LHIAQFGFTVVNEEEQKKVVMHYHVSFNKKDFNHEHDRQEETLVDLNLAGADDLNTLASGWFWRFSQKKQQFSVALPTP